MNTPGIAPSPVPVRLGEPLSEAALSTALSVGGLPLGNKSGLGKPERHRVREARGSRPKVRSTSGSAGFLGLVPRPDLGIS